VGDVTMSRDARSVPPVDSPTRSSDRPPHDDVILRSTAQATDMRSVEPALRRRSPCRRDWVSRDVLKTLLVRSASNATQSNIIGVDPRVQRHRLAERAECLPERTQVLSVCPDLAVASVRTESRPSARSGAQAGRLEPPLGTILPMRPLLGSRCRSMNKKECCLLSCREGACAR